MVLVWGILIFVLTAVITSVKPKRTFTVQTPSGDITFEEKVTNKDDFRDTVAELTKDELMALERDANRANELIEAFVPPQSRRGDILENLDMAFAAWLNSERRDVFSGDDVIRIVGAALGSYDIQHLGVRWARVTDAHGSEIALVSENPPTRSYPFSSVRYRIEDKKTDFIVALYRGLEHSMNSAAK